MAKEDRAKDLVKSLEALHSVLDDLVRSKSSIIKSMEVSGEQLPDGISEREAIEDFRKTTDRFRSQIDETEKAINILEQNAQSPCKTQ